MTDRFKRKGMSAMLIPFLIGLWWSVAAMRRRLRLPARRP